MISYSNFAVGTWVHVLKNTACRAFLQIKSYNHNHRATYEDNVLVWQNYIINENLHKDLDAEASNG